MDYAIKIDRHGSRWCLSFPDIPDYAAMGTHCHELLADVQGYLDSALFGYCMGGFPLPDPRSAGEIRVEPSEMMVLRLRLCEELARIAASHPESLERSLQFIPESVNDIYTAVLEYDDDDIFLTYREQNIPFEFPAPTSRAAGLGQKVALSDEAAPACDLPMLH